MRLAPILDTLSIEAKSGGIIPLKPNWAQRRLVAEVEASFNEGRPTRIVVLKSRQVGISTIVEAILFACCVRSPSVNAVVMAHDVPSTEYLFAKTKLYYEEWPYKDQFPTKYSSRRQLTLAGNRSMIQVMVANRRGAGRGRTIHYLHASEMGFWADPVTTWGAVAQSIPDGPGSIVIIESTANGMGNLFEEMWSGAVDGSNGYTPLFFPWFKHPDCLPCVGRGCENGTCSTCDAAGSGVKARNDIERDLVKLGCTPAHLAWRRRTLQDKCHGDEDFFRQEYCATAEEAFIASGVHVFPEAHLKNCFEPLEPIRGQLVRDDRQVGKVRFIENPAGPLKVFRRPAKDTTWGQYFVGADVGYGVAQGDYSAAQVIRRPQDGHPAEQVAVFHARLAPVAYADELAKLGAWYNQAQVAVEVEGPGQGTIARLSSIYPHIWRQAWADKPVGRNQSEVQLGWSTNWKRKAWLVSQLGDRLERATVILHDRATYNELRIYTMGASADGFVRYAASGDGHDDLVMGLGIAVLCESIQPPVEPEVVPRGRLAGDGVVWAELEQEGAEPWA